jgi:hypothetical protein
VEKPMEQSDSLFGEKHQEFNNTFSEIMVDNESHLNNGIFDYDEDSIRLKKLNECKD